MLSAQVAIIRLAFSEKMKSALKASIINVSANEQVLSFNGPTNCTNGFSNSTRSQCTKCNKGCKCEQVDASSANSLRLLKEKKTL